MAKIENLLKAMSPDQRHLLDQLLSGEWIRVVILGETYAAKPNLPYWEVRSVNEGEPTHVVDALFRSCTCPAYKFRGHICKHVQAVERITRGCKADS